MQAKEEIRMTGVHFSPGEGSKLVERNIAKAPLADDEVLVNVLRAGICNTDLEIIKADYADFEGIVGHEFVGVVMRTGKGAKKWLGKRICADINVPCKKCSLCTDKTAEETQRRNHCSYRKCLGIRKMDGCFATHLRLPADNLHLVPDNVTDAIAVFAEPLAAALRPLEQRLISVTARTAIVGDGKLGMLIGEVLVMRLRLMGISNEETEERINLFGHHPERSFINSAPHFLAPSRHNRKNNDEETQPSSIMYHNTDVGYRFFNNRESNGIFDILGWQFDVVIEASGSSSGLLFATQLVKPQGRIILKTTIGTKSIRTEDLKALEAIVVKEINVCGSRCGPIQDALDILSGQNVPSYMKGGDTPVNQEALKSLKLEKYISHVFALSDAMSALEEASKKGAMKVQLVVLELDQPRAFTQEPSPAKHVHSIVNR